MLICHAKFCLLRLFHLHESSHLTLQVLQHLREYKAARIFFFAGNLFASDVKRFLLVHLYILIAYKPSAMAALGNIGPWSWHARLVSCLLYGTLFLIVKRSSGGLHFKGLENVHLHHL